MQNTSPYPTQEKSRYSIMNLLVTVIVIGMLGYFINYLVGHKSIAKAEPTATPTALSVSGIATTVATHAAGKRPCNAVNAECGDHSTWKEWPDVDRTTLGSPSGLYCQRVHMRHDTGAGYDMANASHTEIATWFSLTAQAKVDFLNSCNK